MDDFLTYLKSESRGVIQHQWGRFSADLKLVASTHRSPNSPTLSLHTAVPLSAQFAKTFVSGIGLFFFFRRGTWNMRPVVAWPAWRSNTWIWPKKCIVLQSLRWISEIGNLHWGLQDTLVSDMQTWVQTMTVVSGPWANRIFSDEFWTSGETSGMAGGHPDLFKGLFSSWCCFM